MSSPNRGPNPQVKDFYLKARETLQLQAALQRVGFNKNIKADATGKAFSNLQLWGKKEHDEFLRLSPKMKQTRLAERFEGEVAGIIFANGYEIPQEAEALARLHKVALFTTPLTKKICANIMAQVLYGFFPKEITVAGGLLQVDGLGVLILGDSGVGKSECALELISRGNLLVSDDVTIIKKTVDGSLRGRAPSLSQNFMEIRGLSIINIEQIYGAAAICRVSQVDLAIYLERWEIGKEYDRLGLETPEKYEILGVQIPQVTIPVAPGRNITTLIEVACKVHILRKKGYHAPREIARRLDRALSSQEN
jgi:HPr kinase/phosphorylase